MKKILYKDLNPKQKENYNYQRASSILAEYGFLTIKLSDDWNGADFLAIPFKNPDKILKVQLKGRLTFAKKYEDKEIQICFEDKNSNCWYLYDHDKLLKELSFKKNFINTSSWIVGKVYSFNSLGKAAIESLKVYRL